MEIVDVKIRMMECIDKMKAIASVNFEDEFVVHDIKVIEGKNGLFVVMPSKKVAKNKFVDVAHPLKSSVRMKLQKAVIDAYYTSIKEEFIDDDELEKRLDTDFDTSETFLNNSILNPLTKGFEDNIIEVEITPEEIEFLYELNPEKEIDTGKSELEVFEDVAIEESAIEDNISEIPSNTEKVNGVRKNKLNKIDETKDFIEQLLNVLVDRERILPGEELYINDFIQNRDFNERIAENLKNKFKNFSIDCLVALEDISCLLAYEVAKKLDLELIIIKRGSNHNHGAGIAVNYFDDRNKTLKTLTLPKRYQLEQRACVLICNEIKDGGIIKGIENLLSQFNCQLKGIGSLIDYTNKHKELPVYSYSLFRYAGIDDNEIPIIY